MHSKSLPIIGILCFSCTILCTPTPEKDKESLRRLSNFSSKFFEHLKEESTDDQPNYPKSFDSALGETLEEIKTEFVLPGGSEEDFLSKLKEQDSAYSSRTSTIQDLTNEEETNLKKAQELLTQCNDWKSFLEKTQKEAEEENLKTFTDTLADQTPPHNPLQNHPKEEFYQEEEWYKYSSWYEERGSTRWMGHLGTTPPKEAALKKFINRFSQYKTDDSFYVQNYDEQHQMSLSKLLFGWRQKTNIFPPLGSSIEMSDSPGLGDYMQAIGSAKRKNMEECFELLKNSAQNGYLPAFAALMYSYKNGLGTKTNTLMAYKIALDLSEICDSYHVRKTYIRLRSHFTRFPEMIPHPFDEYLRSAVSKGILNSGEDEAHFSKKFEKKIKGKKAKAVVCALVSLAPKGGAAVKLIDKIDSVISNLMDDFPDDFPASPSGEMPENI